MNGLFPAKFIFYLKVKLFLFGSMWLLASKNVTFLTKQELAGSLHPSENSSDSKLHEEIYEYFWCSESESLYYVYDIQSISLPGTQSKAIKEHSRKYFIFA